MGKCPDCGDIVGPMSILMSCDNWGKFVCPGCGNQIQFKNWLFAVLVLAVLFIGAERLLHFMLVFHLSLWQSFTISFILSWLIMFIVPMIWNFKKTN